MTLPNWLIYVLVFFAFFGLGAFLIAGWMIAQIAQIGREEQKMHHGQLLAIKKYWAKLPQEAH